MDSETCRIPIFTDETGQKWLKIAEIIRLKERLAQALGELSIGMTVIFATHLQQIICTFAAKSQ